MDCSNSSFWKVDKFDMLFLVFVLIVTLSVVTFAVESEGVDVTYVSGLGISPNNNYFFSYDTYIGYFPLEPGYIYYIYNNGSAGRFLALSPELPQLNGSYSYLSYLHAGETYSYLSTYNSSFLYFDAGGGSIVVTREKVTDMNGVVSILSDDVGVNQFWRIFEFAIPFVAIVVLVVLGFFFVSKLMKKSSRGDIKF